MAASFLSRVIGLVRVKYIAWLFGSGYEADALTAAFVLPDMISYFLVGGAASISFVSILTRYRESGREEEGNRSLSVILTTMYLVLGAAILIAELAAPLWVHWWFSGFDAQKAALCVQLTRILLPAQLFFFAGGVFGAVLIVHKQFSVQAIAPLIYSGGTIVGGVFLFKLIGPVSLAIGTTAGALCGPLLLNWYYARQLGTRYRVMLDWQDEGLREWVRLSLPLMLGVSVVTADNWIIAYFASHTNGGIALMNYAKLLFTAPTAMLAQAAGMASMPFFASLWAQEKRYEFAVGVADSVSRVASLGLLASAAMIALGQPMIRLFFLGGRFMQSDATLCTRYFVIFSVTLCLWGAQSLYARAFFAAGKTLEPAVVGTIVTVVSIPLYALLYHHWGVMGLAVASNLAITLQTVAIAVLLHQRHMVSLASLDFAELGRCLLAGLISGTLVWSILHGLEHLLPQPGTLHLRLALNGALLLAGGAVWMVVAFGLLEKTGSALPRVLLQRLKLR